MATFGTPSLAVLELSAPLASNHLLVGIWYSLLDEGLELPRVDWMSIVRRRLGGEDSHAKVHGSDFGPGRGGWV